MELDGARWSPVVSVGYGNPISRINSPVRVRGGGQAAWMLEQLKARGSGMWTESVSRGVNSSYKQQETSRIVQSGKERCPISLRTTGGNSFDFGRAKFLLGGEMAQTVGL